MRYNQSIAAAICLFAVQLSAQSAAASAPAPKPAPSPAFAKIKALAGVWKAKTAMGPSTLTFTVISGGNCVEERLVSGKTKMLTVYCAEGEGVALTHYCDAGNQPRMKADGLGADGNSLAFAFTGVSNLATPETGHMRRLDLTIRDAKHVTSVWTFHENGKEMPYTFDFTRVK